MKKVLHVSFSGQTLANRCEVADSFFSRLVGLLNRDGLSSGEALLIEPCNQIHTFFMRFPISVVFLSKENRVIAWGNYLPWRISPLHFKARKVLELPLGSLDALKLEKGAEVEMRSC